MEDISDGDYRHPERVCKNFKTKKLGEYHDLYVENDTLLLAGRICVLKYMGLILLIFLCTRITMASSVTKEQSKIRSIS